MKTLLTTVAATALFASAMATAAPQPTPAEIKAELARFTEVAAAPVERYTTVSLQSTRFKPVGDEHVVVYTRPTTAYLLTLDGRCEGLRNSQGIMVDGGARTVFARTSYVFVTGPDNPAGMRCKIEQIQPLDLKSIAKK